jgi:hypothetical protein
MYVANFAASNQALHLIGKEMGMFGDKKDAPLDENANKSIEELTQEVIDRARKLNIDLPGSRSNPCPEYRRHQFRKPFRRNSLTYRQLPSR